MARGSPDGVKTVSTIETELRTIATQLSAPAIPADRTLLIVQTEAFAGLYAQTHLIVFRYIYGLYGGPQQDVEDLTAEVYMRAWRARGRFRGDEDNALRWLLQIARHIVIDAHRRNQRRGLPENIDELAIAERGSSPEEQALDNEQRVILRGLLKDLPTRQREMLVLRYMLDWQVKRIAQYLEMPPNTVSVTIRRALERLRQAWPQASAPDQPGRGEGE